MARLRQCKHVTISETEMKKVLAGGNQLAASRFVSEVNAQFNDQYRSDRQGVFCS